MPNLLARSLLAAAALFCGAILGYFVVFATIIPAATKSIVEWFAPLAKDINIWLYARDAQYLLIATFVFVSKVPNVVLLSFLVALSMKALRRPRLVFYATLAWPVLYYLIIIDLTLRINVGLTRWGLNYSDVTSLTRAQSFPAKAVGMFLVYSLFAALVFIIYRRLMRVRHKPPLNMETPPDGGAPVS